MPFTCLLLVVCGEISAFEDPSVGHFVIPLNAEDVAEAVHVEAVQFPLLFGVHCPCFTAIEESADYPGVLHFNLG